MGTPANKNPLDLTEADYWRDYEIIRNDVNAAIVSCHTYNAINRVAVDDINVWQRMNRHPNFWRISAFSLQTTMFITLARILDHNTGVHSIHSVLNSTVAHPEFFSKPALKARKLSIPGAKWDLAELDDYVRSAWEPTVDDLRRLKKALAPHKARFDKIYKPSRDQVFAHTVLRDEALVADLFGKTLKTDIDEILRFLHGMLLAIRELADNARPPDLNGDKYGYRTRVAEITRDTEAFLRELGEATTGATLVNRRTVKSRVDQKYMAEVKE